MYDFTLHQNINSFNKSANSNKFFSAPQRLYWLNNSANLNKNKKPDNEKKHSHKATALIVLALGLLFASKGVQTKSKYSLVKLKEHLENRLDKLIVKNSTRRISFYEYSIRRINSFIEKSESINNFNSLKDILFMKFMHKTTPTKKIHQGITKFFEYISKNTVKKSYKTTRKNFDKMYENFDTLDDYIIKNHGDEIVEYTDKRFKKVHKLSKKELIDIAKGFRQTAKIVVDIFIDEKAQNTRYGRMKSTTSKLNSEFWDKSFKGFWTKENKFKRKEMWQTFIASEQIKANKTELAELVAFARKVLSYADSEKKFYISRYIDNLNSYVPLKDEEGIDIIKRLKWYTKDKTPIEINKDNFLNELERFENHNIKTSPDEKIAKLQLEDKDKNIRLIRDIVTDTDEGEIKDMMDIYRQIAPFELSKSGAFESAKKAIASFDKSVNLEIGEMFDKLRDLEIGSAPTDILTILISTAMIIRALEKTDDKKERSTIMLKSGIPIAGAITTSLISATKLVSGSKSIALGFVSGIILNRIGSALANKNDPKA